MERIDLLSSKHLVLNSPPWNSAYSSFSPSRSPQSPVLPHQKRTIFPSASHSDETRFIHSCMILLIVCRKRQTDTQMGRQTVVTFFLHEISQPCCLKNSFSFIAHWSKASVSRGFTAPAAQSIRSGLSFLWRVWWCALTRLMPCI